MKKTDFSVTCHDVEGNTYEVPASELVFRPAVYGVIIEDGKILLSKCWDGYDFPGGGIELGEPTDKAIIREVKEETGLNVKPGRIMHANHSFFKLPYKGTFVHSIHLYFECSITGGKLSTKFFDEQEKKYATMAEWVDLERLDELTFYSSVSARAVLGQTDSKNPYFILGVNNTELMEGK